MPAPSARVRASSADRACVWSVSARSCASQRFRDVGDVRSCRDDLRQAQRIHHGEAGSLGQRRRQRMGRVANDGDAADGPGVEARHLVHVIAPARADRLYRRDEHRKDAAPYCGIDRQRRGLLVVARRHHDEIEPALLAGCVEDAQDARLERPEVDHMLPVPADKGSAIDEDPHDTVLVFSTLASKAERVAHGRAHAVGRDHQVRLSLRPSARSRPLPAARRRPANA